MLRRAVMVDNDGGYGSDLFPTARLNVPTHPSEAFRTHAARRWPRSAHLAPCRG
ncbi:MAG: hypothetical protein ACYC3A_01330 [Halothiobacillus sp.]